MPEGKALVLFWAKNGNTELEAFITEAELDKRRKAKNEKSVPE